MTLRERLRNRFSSPEATAQKLLLKQLHKTHNYQKEGLHNKLKDLWVQNSANASITHELGESYYDLYQSSFPLTLGLANKTMKEYLDWAADPQLTDYDTQRQCIHRVCEHIIHTYDHVLIYDFNEYLRSPVACSIINSSPSLLVALEEFHDTFPHTIKLNEISAKHFASAFDDKLQRFEFRSGDYKLEYAEELSALSLKLDLPTYAAKAWQGLLAQDAPDDHVIRAAQELKTLYETHPNDEEIQKAFAGAVNHLSSVDLALAKEHAADWPHAKSELAETYAAVQANEIAEAIQTRLRSYRGEMAIAYAAEIQIAAAVYDSHFDFKEIRGYTSQCTSMMHDTVHDLNQLVKLCEQYPDNHTILAWFQYSLDTAFYDYREFGLSDNLGQVASTVYANPQQYGLQEAWGKQMLSNILSEGSRDVTQSMYTSYAEWITRTDTGIIEDVISNFNRTHEMLDDVLSQLSARYLYIHEQTPEAANVIAKTLFCAASEFPEKVGETLSQVEAMGDTDLREVYNNLWQNVKPTSWTHMPLARIVKSDPHNAAAESLHLAKCQLDNAIGQVEPPIYEADLGLEM